MSNGCKSLFLGRLRYGTHRQTDRRSLKDVLKNILSSFHCVFSFLFSTLFSSLAVSTKLCPLFSSTHPLSIHCHPLLLCSYLGPCRLDRRHGTGWGEDVKPSGVIKSCLLSSFTDWLTDRLTARKTGRMGQVKLIKKDFQPFSNR